MWNSKRPLICSNSLGAPCNGSVWARRWRAVWQKPKARVGRLRAWSIPRQTKHGRSTQRRANRSVISPSGDTLAWVRRCSWFAAGRGSTTRSASPSSSDGGAGSLAGGLCTARRTEAPSSRCREGDQRERDVCRGPDAWTFIGAAGRRYVAGRSAVMFWHAVTRVRRAARTPSSLRVRRPCSGPIDSTAAPMRRASEGGTCPCRSGHVRPFEPPR